MDQVTISTKYQVVIPKRIREEYGLKPGQRVTFIPYKHSLRMIIVPPIQDGFGMLPDLDTQVDRDEEDRV